MICWLFQAVSIATASWMQILGTALAAWREVQSHYIQRTRCHKDNGFRKWRLPLFVLCAVLILRMGIRRVRHSECHSRHSFTSTMQAVHIGTLGTTLAAWREVQSHYIQRTPHLVDEGFRKWRLPTLPRCNAVPSAMLSLTTLFGMGRGGTSAL